MPNLWSFPPLLGIQETLDHFSSVLSTRTTEQRLSLRYKPRQTFQYVSHLDDYKYAQAKAFAGLNSTSSVYVPVWLEAVRLHHGVYQLDTSIKFDTTYGDWRAGGHLVVWESYDRYAICAIDNTDDEEVTLTAPVGMNFSQPYVIPIRTCLAKQGYQFARKATYIRVTTVFSVQDNIQLIADDASSLAGFDFYKTLLVLPAPPHDGANIAESIIRPMTYFDSGLGPVVAVTSRVIDDFGQTISFLDAIGPDLWERRKFLHWIRGKQIPFWWPSYNNDLQLVDPISAADTTITIRRLAAENVYTGDEIMILTKGGTRYYRTINNYSVGLSGDILTLSSALGVAISLDEINMICFMKKVRSNSDSFTLTQEAPNLVSMTMPVLAIPE